MDGVGQGGRASKPTRRAKRYDARSVHRPDPVHRGLTGLNPGCNGIQVHRRRVQRCRGSRAVQPTCVVGQRRESDRGVKRGRGKVVIGDRWERGSRCRRGQHRDRDQRRVGRLRPGCQIVLHRVGQAGFTVEARCRGEGDRASRGVRRERADPVEGLATLHANRGQIQIDGRRIERGGRAGTGSSTRVIRQNRQRHRNAIIRGGLVVSG